MDIKKVALLIGTMALGLTANAEVILNIANGAGKNVTIEQTPLNQSDATPKPINLTTDADGSLKFEQAVFPVVINISEGTDPIATRIFSADGKENIVIDADGQGDFSATGTALMEGVTKVNKLLSPYMQHFQELAAYYDTNPESTIAQIDALSADINTALTNYISSNPAAPEVPYALMMLDGQEFLDAYPLLGDAHAQSILMPSVEQKKQSEEQTVAQERMMQQLESGTVDAPAITLPDLNGKMVSLSDFKGKWVIIDFWGSWCRWCVKGFPELKELQQKYGDELVIFGVDCRDTPDKWREAVKKYDMTWVNVYNDCTQENNPILSAYYVQGFPTKVIVGPDGKIKKIVVGADPTFPNTLAKLMGK
ncbi:MAG: TlpA family protein disulfide reductase [Muribaculaceae bacterium]|nr:TlpA family protein disulfide reductase [Muribaculaceae bacterium]